MISCTARFRSIGALILAVFLLPISASLARASDSIPLALRLSFTPAHLAAAGANAEQSLLLLAALDAAEPDRAALSAADASLAQAQSALSAAQTSLDDDPTDENRRAAAEAARQAVDLAWVEVHTRESALQAIAAATLTPDQQALWPLLVTPERANLPPDLCACDEPEQGWAALESALASEAASTRANEPTPEDAAAILNDSRSDPSAIAAKSRLDQYLAEVRQAFGEMD